MISVTLSAQIIILPVMLYHFNIIGIYFLLANILVSIIITPIMILAIIFVFLSFINLEISKFISIFLSWGIEGLIQIANLSNLPFSKSRYCFSCLRSRSIEQHNPHHQYRFDFWFPVLFLDKLQYSALSLDAGYKTTLCL